jgi:membrane fusion protein
MDGSGGVPQEPAAGERLFRPEVLRERQAQWLGTVLLAPRPLHWSFGALALLTIAVVLAALFGASYTKRARVSGWLVPQQGLLRVVAPRAGVTTTLLVREGAQVAQGQPLAELSAEEYSAALGDTQARAASALDTQRSSLEAERARFAELLLQQRAALARRVTALAGEGDSLRQEIAVQQGRLALARQWEARIRELQGRGYVSEQQVRTASEAALDQAAKLRALERSALALERERASAASELEQLPLKSAAQEALIARSLAATGRELAEVEARRALVIRAPQAGVVTALHAAAGDAVTPAAPLLSILPQGAVLEAHLYAPSRAVGFVQAGQAVLLRYRAYPYQKFGHARGVIRSVSRSAITPQELPPVFAAGSATPAEPLYRITVGLERQAIDVAGRAYPLQAGMQLDADVLLERRRLAEWLLDPLYTLSRR